MQRERELSLWGHQAGGHGNPSSFLFLAKASVVGAGTVSRTDPCSDLSSVLCDLKQLLCSSGPQFLHLENGVVGMLHGNS